MKKTKISLPIVLCVTICTVFLATLYIYGKNNSAVNDDSSALQISEDTTKDNFPDTQLWEKHTILNWGMSFEYPSSWELEERVGTSSSTDSVWLEGDGFTIGLSSNTGRGLPEGEYTQPSYEIGGQIAEKSFEWKRSNGFEQLIATSDSVCNGSKAISIINYQTTSKEISNRFLNSIVCQ